MNELNETGGAKIGLATASWPFAKLHVTNKTLTLNATILGKLVFARSDIQSIEVYRKFGFRSKGIQINHSVPNYRKTVVFFTANDPQQLINEISKTGFFDSNVRLNAMEELELKEAQRQGGFPFRMPFVVAVIILWNLLSFIDPKKLFDQGIVQFGLAKGFVFSTGMLLLVCLLLLFFQPFQRLVLKEGKQLKDIRLFVYFLLLISLLLFVAQLFIP
jgi:hypothetical protein